MFGGIFGHRSSQASKKRPSHASKTTDRSKAGEGEDATQDAVDKKPDVEELRRRRQSYYSLSPAQRRQVAASATSATKSKSSRRSSTARSSASKNGDRRHRKTAGNSSSKVKAGGQVPSRNRAEEYVYGTQPIAEPAGEATVDAVGEHADEERREERHGRSEKRHSTRHGSAKRRSLPTVLESEVTPDDSVSQVAERQDERRHAAHSRKRYSRPSMKRSSTASSKLPSVDETQEEHSQTPRPTKRSSRRESVPAAPPAPNRRHSTTSVPSSTKLVECLTCGSDDIPLPKSAELSCSHRMCHDCLKRIFEMSVKDPAHMPPKCCNEDHIPLKYVDKLFDTKFKVLWNRKYQEYHTKNRIYCPTPKCGEWIKPKHMQRTMDGRKYALCPRCKTKVCTLCNNKMHRSSDCPQDPEIAKLVEQAKEKGWQRCYSCKAMVELQSGCNHMTCRCKAEFCILCGAQWKTCNCPWFNYSQIPNPDALNDMRVPEPVRVIFRRVVDAAGGMPLPGQWQQQQQNQQPPPNVPGRARQAPAAPPPEVTYQQELDNRREQERADAELARRLQLASLWDNDDPAQPIPRRRPPPEDQTWGIGNAAGHFMNENFVQNAANVVMGAFGDEGFGRRGERSAGRRRRVRQTREGGEGAEERDPGLAPNFLGDESVLGVGPAAPAGRRR